MAQAAEEKEAGPPSAFVVNPYLEEMMNTANHIATRGKGILAADESTGTIGKRLAMIDVANEEPNRQRYRELLFTTPDLGKYISGAILFEETLYQKSKDGTPFVDILKKQNVIPGIKVDKGTRDLQGCPGEKWTQGLTDLDLRAAKYYEAGARFCKWRAVLVIQNGYISETAIKENAWGLARYAAICQSKGLVPIVEPEILMDGSHSLQINQYWTEKVVAACYKALSDCNVVLEATLLKPNMCLPGKQYKGKKAMKDNALATVTALKRSVPSAVPGIMFLSGGQSEEEATMNLNAINSLGDLPWSASFSYGRALQQSCLKAWKGKDANLKAGQDALMVRAKANSEAQLGKYTGDAATDDAKATLYEAGYTY